MLEEALAESDAAEAAAAPVVQNPEMAAPSVPDMNATEMPGVTEMSAENDKNSNAMDAGNSGNPESAEINGVPEVNVAAEQGDVLPPPPAPPVNLEMTMPGAENANEENVVKNTTEDVGGSNTLGTFQIPG